MRGRIRTLVRALVSASVVFAAAVAATGALAQAQDTKGTQEPPPPGVSASLDRARALRGEQIEVAVLTYGAGDAVFERFGHIALALTDNATGQRLAFNWGMFDFSQPNFLGRFLSGETRYWMAGFDTDAFNALYRQDNRRIRRQQLKLSPVQRAALFEFVAWNAREENRFYRYDYYADNCATRVRDAIDRVMGGVLRTAWSGDGAGRTWRGETARITASDIPTYAGIQIALGRNADRTLTKWEEGFLPEYLAEHLASFVVEDSDGRRYNLVASDTVLFEPTRIPMPTEPPSRLAMAALVGLTLAGLIAGLADARQRAARVALSVGVALWYVLGGVLGTLLLLAGTVTKHAPYMGDNTTVLQLHPLLLLAAWPVARALARGEHSRTAIGLSTIVALLSVCGALLQLLPSLTQASGEVLAVTVPVHVALALAMWRLHHDHAGQRRVSVALSRAA